MGVLAPARGEGEAAYPPASRREAAVGRRPSGETRPQHLPGFPHRWEQGQQTRRPRRPRRDRVSRPRGPAQCRHHPLLHAPGGRPAWGPGGLRGGPAPRPTPVNALWSIPAHAGRPMAGSWAAACPSRGLFSAHSLASTNFLYSAGGNLIIQKRPVSACGLQPARVGDTAPSSHAPGPRDIFSVSTS